MIVVSVFVYVCFKIFSFSKSFEMMWREKIEIKDFSLNIHVMHPLKLYLQGKSHIFIHLHGSCVVLGEIEWRGRPLTDMQVDACFFSQMSSSFHLAFLFVSTKWKKRNENDISAENFLQQVSKRCDWGTCHDFKVLSVGIWHSISRSSGKRGCF